MKVLRDILLIFLAGFILIPGCDSILNDEDQTAIDGDRVFNDPALAVLYLNSIYKSTLPSWSATSNIGMTDESVGTNNYLTGTVENPTSANPDQTNGDYSPTTYGHLRNISVFIEQIERGQINETTKNEMIGQALFLRAWVHWGLVLSYGGIPMVTEVLDNNDEISDELPRLPASECIQIIVDDLDQAIEYIGEYGSTGYGRITKSAAAALKGRVLLFYASPMFVPDGMTNADGIATRWEAAYQANLEAKSMAESEGHRLYDDFTNIFVNEDNPEAIFFRQYAVGLGTHGFENSVRPKSVNNANDPDEGPCWDFVESFPMLDGKLAGESDKYTYDTASYWANRDPRFYATVGYNSIPWSFAGREGNRQWAYEGNAQESGNLPPTGFYLKKHVNTAITNTQTVFTPTDWIEIRFAEVLLNLAECANEVGRQGEALDELYAIRSRAGIEEGDGTYGIPTGPDKAGLREVIMNERKIELAFENKRFWDIKRRNLYANGIDGTSGEGLNTRIRKFVTTTVDTDFIISNNAGIAAANNPEDSAFQYFEAVLLDSVDWSNPTNYANYFETNIQDADVQAINFLQPEYNFNFLPINALAKNNNLEQTIYWLDENGEEGTFDPLAD